MVRPIVVTRNMSHEAIISLVLQPVRDYSGMSNPTYSQIYTHSILTAISSQPTHIYDGFQISVCFPHIRSRQYHFLEINLLLPDRGKSALHSLLDRVRERLLLVRAYKITQLVVYDGQSLVRVLRHLRSGRPICSRLIRSRCDLKLT